MSGSEGLAHRIRKRQSKSVDRNTCTLALVVDYRFYTFLLSSENAVITTLVGHCLPLIVLPLQLETFEDNIKIFLLPCNKSKKFPSILFSLSLSASLFLSLSLQVSRVSRVDSGSFRPTQWVIDANGNTLTNQGLQIGTVQYVHVLVCVCVCVHPNMTAEHQTFKILCSVCACINCMMNTLEKYDCCPFIKYIFLDYHTHWTLF